MRDYRIIDSDAALAPVIDALLDEDRYALDTEFHRERTYWPKVALIQIAWPDDLVLIDPLEVDLAPLKELMSSFAEAGGTMYVCAPCFKKRGLDETRLVQGAKIVGGAKLVEFMADGAPSVSY